MQFMKLYLLLYKSVEFWMTISKNSEWTLSASSVLLLIRTWRRWNMTLPARIADDYGEFQKHQNEFLMNQEFLKPGDHRKSF